jgi:hypothetical protein
LYIHLDALGEIGDGNALKQLNKTLNEEHVDFYKKIDEILVNMGWNSKTYKISKWAV